MIHFSIAYRYSDYKPKPSLLLGSVAPDAVLVRERDKAGKLKSHLYNDLGRVPNIDVYADFIRQNTVNSFDEDYKLFLFGYISHVHTDIMWGKFKKEVSDHNESLKEQLWQEENQMDFMLYRNSTGSDSLVKEIMSSPIYEIKGIYTGPELDLWRKNIFKWLDDPDNEPNIMNIYITESRVETFINQMTEELKGLYQELFK